MQIIISDNGYAMLRFDNRKISTLSQSPRSIIWGKGPSRGKLPQLSRDKVVQLKLLFKLFTSSRSTDA
ncbi:hypothetical protein FOXYSP1_06583 [Fusarium oxysporum f. sp. phaseoli]